MNNFRRSVEEVVQVVKIADSTVRKRLEEFKGTRSGELTVADFRSVWLEEEMDPPAFIKGKEREEREREEAAAAAEEEQTADPNVGRKGKHKAGKQKKKKKRKRGDDTDEEEDHRTPVASASEDLERLLPSARREAIDPALLNEGILEGAFDLDLDLPPLFYPDDPPSVPPPIDSNIDPSLQSPSHPFTSERSKSQDQNLSSPSPSHGLTTTEDMIDETASTLIAEEVSNFLQNPQGAQLSSALDEAEERRLAQLTVGDDLMGLDEEELDRFILTEDEVKIKERVWVELNKDYLEAIAGGLNFFSGWRDLFC